MKRHDVVAALLAVVVAGLVPALPGAAAADGCAYYLFLAGSREGCEECYVPLLVVGRALDEVAASGRDTTGVLITTYERDAIWTIERDVSLAAADISARERLVRLRGRPYRYQQVAPVEVLRLLEKPEGTVSIHRVAPIPDRKSLEDLIALLRSPGRCDRRP